MRLLSSWIPAIICGIGAAFLIPWRMHFWPKLVVVALWALLVALAADVVTARIQHRKHNGPTAA